ncbi:MAG TPA: ABC transporter permease subunit [Solirubrobacterales bacterium]|nr:ABC transporter permease subunit [Solirubrobacterales bacterium]
MNLLQSEWIKLFTTRTTWAMLGIGLLCEGLFAGLFSGLVSLDGLTELEELETTEPVPTGTGLLMVLVLILGVLIITSEFRHGTSSSTFLATPKRWPDLLAKLGIALAVGVVAGLAFVLVNGGLSIPLFEGRGAELPATDRLVEIYAGVVVSFALLAAFGMGIGAIVRNQVGAMIAAIAFFFIVSALPELLPGSIGEYFPAQALGSLHGHVEGDGTLNQLEGGFVLAAWAAGLVALGTLLVCSRDVSE